MCVQYYGSNGYNLEIPLHSDTTVTSDAIRLDKRSVNSRRRKRGQLISPIGSSRRLFRTLYFPFVARAEDTGLYTCIALSGNAFFDNDYDYEVRRKRGLPIDPFPSVVTTRSVNITVTGNKWLFAIF